MIRGAFSLLEASPARRRNGSGVLAAPTHRDKPEIADIFKAKGDSEICPRGMIMRR